MLRLSLRRSRTVTGSAKRVIRRLLKHTGWELKHFSPQSSERARLVRQLGVHKINVVLDIGANTGQYAIMLRDAGFLGRIISFEACPTAHRELVYAAQGDPAWIVAPRMAVGDRNCTATFNIAANSESSSLLPMLPLHLRAAPESQYIGSEEVEVRKLDDVAHQFLKSGDRVFLKLDVQGFEYQVLRAATSILHQVAGLQIELSLVPLYEGGQLFDSMLSVTAQSGFELWSLIPAFVDNETGRLLQVDGVFFRFT